MRTIQESFLDYSMTDIGQEISSIGNFNKAYTLVLAYIASFDHESSVFLNFHSPDNTDNYDDSVEDPGIRI